MPPSPGRLPRFAIVAVLALVIIPTAAIPADRARAGTDTPPEPFSFGALKGIGALAAPGEPINHVAIWWDEVIDLSSIPDKADFRVTINGGAAVVPDGVSTVYSGFAGHEVFGPTGVTFMRLDLPANATWSSADDVRLTYTPGAHRVRDRALNDAAGLPALKATAWDFGELDVLGAVVDSAHARDRILLVLTLPIDPGSIPAPTEFTVHDGATPLGVATVTPVFTDTGLGVLDLQLEDPIPDAERSVTLTYDPVGEPITGTRGGTLEGFPDLPVALLLPSDSASATVPAGGGSVSTATDAGPTAPDPVGTTVTSPTGGEVVTIVETSVSQPAPGAFAFFGQQVEITAPAATPDEPLVIRFEIDASVVPAGQDHTSVSIFRDGVVVPECAGDAGVPDPACVSDRLPLGDGDVAITVLTVEASSWNFGIVPPVTFGGFQPPVDGGVPNLAKAGSAIPVKFSLGGDRGLEIFEAGAPSVTLVDCTTAEADAVETTVIAGQSGLTYDEATDTYTYVWKTSRAWQDTCRRLVLAFADGSSVTALFDFRR